MYICECVCVGFSWFYQVNRSGNKDRIELEIKSMWFRGIMANGINPHHSPVHMKVFSDPLFSFRVVPHPHSKHSVIFTRHILGKVGITCWPSVGCWVWWLKQKKTTKRQGPQSREFWFWFWPKDLISTFSKMFQFEPPSPVNPTALLPKVLAWKRMTSEKRRGSCHLLHRIGCRGDNIRAMQR